MTILEFLNQAPCLLQTNAMVGNFNQEVEKLLDEKVNEKNCIKLIELLKGSDEK